MTAMAGDAILAAHSKLLDVFREHGEAQDDELQAAVGAAINLQEWTQ